ncbi:fatty acid synthase-like [Diachasmimorpha longicaudata]|uniref:fatty acid synthase-like n=1 Tax=Diachasmimorpha longicaudata TaxID=58733 RepID=UPI0030B917A1
MLALPKTPTKMGKEKLELAVTVRTPRKERIELSKNLLELADKPHPSSSLMHLTNDKFELAVQLECKMKEIQEQQRRMLELQDKISTNTRLTLTRERSDLAEKLERNMEELNEHQKRLLELHQQNKYDSQLTTNLELQLEERTVKLEASNRERDKLERQLTSMKSELASAQRTLQLERQERKDLEETALGLIRSAKQKWEAAEKDKLSRLTKHIETQTIRITELCTSNNEMSSKLQRVQCDLETAEAELQKLRSFQAQYKQSLAKTRELRRQSVQGVENKLEEISVRAHNQLAEVRLKLEQEIAKNTELESSLRNERDANHCKLSRLNMALELAQSELKDLQEQLRSTQAMIPARDQEIATLKNQLKDKLNQMDGIHVAEQTIAQLTEQLDKVQMENEQMKNQLESTKSDLNDTLLNLRRSENIADDLEKTAKDKAALQERLQESKAKEDEQLRKVDTLEELLQRLQQSVAKLESENAVLKRSSSSIPAVSRASTTRDNSLKVTELEQQIERLEKQLETVRENAATEREAARQAQRSLWKKEKELSDANLDKRIALREAKTSEEKIKTLQEEKQRLTDRLNKKYQDEEEKTKKLLVELESAKSSLTEITKDVSRTRMQADSAQRALIQANKQIEELQSSSATLRRELDAARKQARTSQDRVDSLNAENKRLTFAISKHNEVKSTLETKLEALEQEAKADKVNIDLLKETCTVLEEQLTDYERLTSDHETRENTLVQEKMRLQKELETLEQTLREAKIGQNEEKSKRLISEKTMQRLESETNDIETERDNLLTQRNEYKKLAQELSQQVASLTSKCGELECDIGELQRALESARAEAMIVKEESTDHLTRLHELKDINQDLMADLQSSIDQGQELRIRIAELESVLEEMRQFYNEHEMKSEGTRQQQTKLIDYLQLKLEECSKKKKTVCDRIFRTKQKDTVIPTGSGMPVGYRELENQLTRERAKVKALTEQLLVLKADRQLVSLEPGEEIAISGISGRFPESDNMRLFTENLMNKVDLVTDDGRRWKLDHPEIPQRTGKINNVSKFDALFFGVHFKQAHTMDPMCRMLLEHAYEAIVDAGVNPKQLRGTKTGVFIGACFSESEKTWFYEKLQVNGFGITGCSRAMLANRVSYWLGITGPSYTVDSACSSSLFAMEHAYRAIRNGQCDAAIVGGANLCLHPYVSLQFSRLGVLAPDGRCKSFDADANGYTRSETVSVAFLQKSKDARRIYATVIHGKTNCDGFKEQGITFPSSVMQSALLKEFYEECRVLPSSLSYIEAHGTGTKVGDPEELNAIESVFCQGRKEPLMIGSVKSNLGHAEPASGMGQIAKVVIANETGMIPPNLHYKRPREGVKSLAEGRIVVVSDPTPWKGGYVGVSSFGFGGANAHILLKSNPKEKINGGAPQDDLPRLVVASGRTEEAVNSILTDVESRPVDVEFIRLLHEIHTEDISGHLYRGYTVLGTTNSEKKIRDIEHYPGAKRPIWFVFSGMGSQWATMGSSLLRLPVFANAIKKCDAVLKPHGVDIYDILTNPDKSTFDNILHSFVGIAAVQIGLVDLLTTLGIVPDAIIGHSVGELGCAYADGCFTAEQMVLSAYSRGLASIETDTIKGSMAAVGLGYEEIKDLCPSDIEVACHNGPESSTISGPAESMKAFVAHLTANKIFAREVPCSNIAYHSRYIAAAGPKLLAYLQKVIPDPKPRSSKWFSTSVPRSQWGSPQARLSSAEYHTNNLLSSVLFEETSALIPKDAVTIEIAPHGLLQAILKRSLDAGVTNIALTQRGHKDNVEVFLQAIGKIYDIGLQPVISNLYPEVKFPVSRGTPMISPLVKWEHSDDWYVTSYRMQEKITSGERIVELTLADEDYEYMAGHVIDGRNLLPATGYLALIWETVGMMRGEMYTEVPVVFEDVKFLRATTVSKESLELTLMIQKGTGRFEVVEGGAAVVTGFVHHAPNPQQEQIIFPRLSDDVEEDMQKKDIYKELKLRGYQYSGLFKGIKSASVDGLKGTLAWANNWVAFMDNMLQMKILGLDTRNLLVPTAIQKLTIDTKTHLQQIRDMPDDEKEFKVYTSTEHNVIHSGGVQIRGLKASSIARRKPAGEPVLETYKFVAHRDWAEISMKDAVHLATHLSIENHQGIKLKTLEFLQAGEKYSVGDLLSPILADILADLPMIQADVSIVTPENPYGEDELPENISITEVKKLNAETNAMILAGRNLLAPEKRSALTDLLACLKDGAFVITLESSAPDDINFSLASHQLNIILEKLVNNTKFFLLRKIERIPKNTIIIQVNNNEFSWVNSLKAALKAEVEHETSGSSRVFLISDGTFENGLLGLVNCLRKEPGGEIIRGVLLQDPKSPEFSIQNPLYADHIKLDLVINVLRSKNTWGSYRHHHLPAQQPRLVHHAWANQLVKGDLGSFAWMEGPIIAGYKNPELVSVVYSSLNFRDIMMATGKLSTDIADKTRASSECVLGFEFAGITQDGRRVMGLLNTHRAITNYLVNDPTLTWEVPQCWTLSEAATIPCVYATCYYAFYTTGGINKDMKVLIHAGSGGVGQAAITHALWVGCEIFTTVGTAEKRAFIRKTFPQIPDDHIGNSRDTSFEQMVMEHTDGQGVDIVLNSLADDKLQASLRCLADGGRFLEIGKFDMVNDSPLGMAVFLKEISFHGVLLDRLFNAPPEKKMEVNRMMQAGLNTGAIKPLNMTIFERDQIEPAFRYMAAGKHIGKVILKIQDENNLNHPMPALPVYQCIKDRSYVILGGLGGFGLELADWLVLRGARNLILTSRTGVKDGYQRMRIKLWQSYGVKITIIAGEDASNPKDCEKILSIASKQAPVDGIFNLAVVLKDGLWENQTPETFEESFKAKAWTTRCLDKLSRRLCPKLRHFVVFSSVSCGRGNIGQTNYGMSNSVMERICERRAAEGFPALAIQWGTVGDVGLVADMQDNDKEIVIGGTLQQRITSCLHELDGFLNQTSPIVASMVVAEKRAGGSGSLNIVGTVLNIMGLKDLKSVGVHTSLAELGMDSMMAVEIRQTLEREFEVFLTAQDIRGLNFAKLIEMNSKNLELKKKTMKGMGGEVPMGIKLLVRLLGGEAPMEELCVQLCTKEESGRQEVFMIPGIEGCGAIFSNLASNIRAPASSLQLNNMNTEYQSIPEMADQLLPYVLERNQGRRNFLLVGYSYGSLVAIELARRLEAEAYTGKLILIDGSPLFMKAIKDQQLASENNDELQTNILVGIADIAAPDDSGTLLVELNKCKTWEQKLDLFMERVQADALGISIEQRKNICTCIYNRLLALANYDHSSLPPLRTPITLLKPMIETLKNLPPDYDLSKITRDKVECHVLDGNHVTILDNPKVVCAINGEPLEDAAAFKASIMEDGKILAPIYDENRAKSAS